MKRLSAAQRAALARVADAQRKKWLIKSTTGATREPGPYEYRPTLHLHDRTLEALRKRGLVARDWPLLGSWGLTDAGRAALTEGAE